MGPEDEQLIRYHFGELSPEEGGALAERLAAEPALAARLEELRACLGAAEGESDDASAPRSASPRARRCLLSVAAGRVAREPAADRRWSASDVAFAASALLLVGLLAPPALQASRENARRATCSNHLRAVGASLVAYSEEHGGYFPRIDHGENAGLFAVRLVDAGFVTREELERQLLCPSSPLVNLVVERRAEVVVPTIEEVEAAHAIALERLRRFMGGSYAYRLGHEAEGMVLPVRNRRDCRAPLLSDAPQENGSSCQQHGSCGQNVLFQDGHVRFHEGSWLRCSDDHLFLNTAGRVAAGESWRDVVLAPSDARP